MRPRACFDAERRWIIPVFGKPLLWSRTLAAYFLGDQGHHQPSRRAGELLPVLQERGIQVQYSEDIEAVLSDKGLEGLDGVILYANIDNLGDQQAEAASAFRLTRWWIYSVALCFLLAFGINLKSWLSWEHSSSDIARESSPWRLVRRHQTTL